MTIRSLVRAFPLLLAMAQTLPPAAAQGIPELPAPFEYLRVLDIEKRRIVAARFDPSDATLTCDVLIVGGGVGGVAAAEAAARRGMSVIVTEPTSLLGGQFTSQLVPVPDENSHIEKEPGPSTRSYRALRSLVRAHYAQAPGVIAGREKNIGSCWVSRVSGTPDVWEAAIRQRLQPYIASRRIRRILTRHQLRSVARHTGDGRVNWADFVDLDTGKVTRIGARFLLDATEDGSALVLAGAPTTLGQEARAAFDEPHAPPDEHPEWVQSFTYCFLMRWANSPGPLAPRPAEYDYFASLGEYTLDYIYRGRTPEPYTVSYQVLKTVEKAGGPFWTYRRLRAASNFAGGASPIDDLALINWRGNDFHEESYLDKPLDEQARILERGRDFAVGFARWLQSECPRDEGGGGGSGARGYPEMQLVSGATQPGVAADGFGLHPYIRESRRLQARFTLNENHLLAPPGDPGAKWGETFFDAVGCAMYAVDIHPSKDEPPLLAVALPYHLPLGAFLPASGPSNVIPAAKNFGATRLALASARMHPTEWLAGEVAGSLAAFCLERSLDDPALVRDDPELLTAFQARLRQDGALLRWSEILGPG